MKKRFTHFLILSFTVLLSSNCFAQFPTIYASLGDGPWATLTTWETFTNSGNNIPGAQGTGTPAASAPSGTHYIFIRAGHTVTMGANRNMMGLTIETGATLIAGGSFTLKPATGGGTLIPPFNVGIINNGTLGIAGDVITFEVPVTASTVDIGGNGTYLLGRIRMVGGNLNNPVVNINQNLTLVQTGNYALTAQYNAQPTDNNTINIAVGKTVTVAGATGGYLHQNSIGSGAGPGTYTYNINGTLDLSAFTGTTSVTAISPVGGTVNVNINGALKTGNAFNSSPAGGVANINVPNGVTVDATKATVMNFSGSVFSLAGTGALQRTIPADGTKIRFPIGTSNVSSTHVSISNATGPSEVIAASVKNTFTNPAPANTLQREWNLVETTSGGNSDTLRFEWTTADESNGFSGATPNSVFVLHWNGTAWDATPASMSGTGTTLDPYVAKGSVAFSQLGFFALSNSGTTPVSFVNVKAYQKQTGVQVEFANASESDMINYIIERSADGVNFTAINTISAKGNNGSLNSYAYYDAAPNKESNFYRIKAVERNGRSKYSTILNINLRSKGIWVNAYPNPVKGSNVNVQLENFDKSIYTIAIFNQVGQRVYAKSVNHNGGTATFTVDLPASVKKGVYSLQVSNNVTTVNNKIVVE